MNRALNKSILFRYGKRGHDFWYCGTIEEYDEETLEQTIRPSDGMADLTQNLLKCKKSVIKEWRFLQEAGDRVLSLMDLNEEDIELEIQRHKDGCVQLAED